LKTIQKYIPGLLLTAVLAVISNSISSLLPHGIISGSVIALLLGMLMNPVFSKYSLLSAGVRFSAKGILRLAIILMGLTLSFTQVIQVGKFSLLVMCFTLFTAFGGGYLLGRLLKVNWKLSGLISAGTGICGGSAVAAIAPVIKAQDRDVAYAISATFIFDVLMVILFPLAGSALGMTDMGFGLWAGTAVNDTSSVVAAGYAFSDAAGAYSVIVKLTRTLSIIPAVLAFSYIHSRANQREGGASKVSISGIFPYFILLFLAMVAVKSTGLVPEAVGQGIGQGSKFLMVMALGGIGLKTNFKELSHSGFKPMVLGFSVSALVVLVSLLIQVILGQV